MKLSSQRKTKYIYEKEWRNLSNLWNTVKRNNLWITGVPEGEEGKGAESLFKEIMSKDFPKLGNINNPDSGNPKNT